MIKSRIEVLSTVFFVGIGTASGTALDDGKSTVESSLRTGGCAGAGGNMAETGAPDETCCTGFEEGPQFVLGGRKTFASL